MESETFKVKKYKNKLRRKLFNNTHGNHGFGKILKTSCVFEKVCAYFHLTKVKKRLIQICARDIYQGSAWKINAIAVKINSKEVEILDWLQRYFEALIVGILEI